MKRYLERHRISVLERRTEEELEETLAWALERMALGNKPKMKYES